MPFRAKIDPEGIYWGPEEVDALVADDIPAPDDAIRPGAYRWCPPDADNGVWHWAPLGSGEVRSAPGTPSIEQAFAALVDVIGVDRDLPPAVVAWRAEFAKSVDGRG